MLTDCRHRSHQRSPLDSNEQLMFKVHLRTDDYCNISTDIPAELSIKFALDTKCRARDPHTPQEYRTVTVQTFESYILATFSCNKYFLCIFRMNINIITVEQIFTSCQILS